MFQKLSGKLKYIVITIAILLVVAFVAFALSSLSKNNSIPPEFITARDSGAKYSQDIVNNLQNISTDLSQIQKLESEGKTDDALNLLMQQKTKNDDARTKAVSLTSELEKMTQAVPNITPEKASQSALVALSAETMLIQKLIAYNELMNALYQLVGEQIMTHAANTKPINDTIDQINLATQEINKLNNQFLDEMKSFDGNF